MKIMIVMPYIPYPINNGGRIRSYNLLAHLSSNHDVTLVSLNRELGKTEVANASNEICRIRVLEFFSFAPDALIGAFFLSKLFSISLARYYSRKLQSFISENIEKFDVVIFDSLYSYVNLPLWPNRLYNKKIFLCEQNIEFDLLLQKKTTKSFPYSVLLNYEAQRVRRIELQCIHAVDSVFCVSNLNMEKLKALSGASNVLVAPNGVNTEQLSFKGISNNKKIVFVGSGLYWPNIDAINYFLQDIAPGVSENCPDIKMMIIGRDLNPKAFKKYHNLGLTVEYLSNVPDIKPYIYDAAMFLVPLRFGSGTRIKILEAMALGCPVISTSVGVDGIDGLISGENFLLANTSTEFINAILLILNNKKQAEKIALNARILVENHYDWISVFKSINDQLEKTCETKNSYDNNDYS